MEHNNECRKPGNDNVRHIEGFVVKAEVVSTSRTHLVSYYFIQTETEKIKKLFQDLPGLGKIVSIESDDFLKIVG